MKLSGRLLPNGELVDVTHRPDLEGTDFVEVSSMPDAPGRLGYDASSKRAVPLVVTSNPNPDLDLLTLARALLGDDAAKRKLQQIVAIAGAQPNVPQGD